MRSIALRPRIRLPGQGGRIGSHAAARIAVTLSIVLSTALPLLTGVMALLWAGWVAPERETLPDLSGPRDPRTW
jgi:hypothetical protein